MHRPSGREPDSNQGVSPMRYLLTILMMLVASTASAQVVYMDFFGGDPGFTVDETIGDVAGESAGVVDGAYRVRIHETYPRTTQMAYSPVFDTIGESTYELIFDVNFPEMSVAMPMWIGFSMSDQINAGGLRFCLSWPQAHLSFGDFHGHTYYFNGMELDRWYRVWVLCDPDADIATLRVLDPATGAVLYEEPDVPFVPGPFNQFAMGAETIWGEGTWGTILVDNLVVDGPLPNENQSWSDLKALYR